MPFLRRALGSFFHSLCHVETQNVIEFRIWIESLYLFAAILKDSDFSEADRAECQFTTTTTVLDNGSQVCLQLVTYLLFLRSLMELLERVTTKDKEKKWTFE